MNPRQNDCTVRRAISPDFRAKARIAFTRSLSQARLPDSTQDRLVVSIRYEGSDAPSDRRPLRAASRRSGGFVSTTYAAAAPAATRTTFATVRAVSRVMSAPSQLRREPPGVDVGPGWLPRVCSGETPRMLS